MTEDEIRRHLRTNTIGRRLVLFDELDSTNLYAKSMSRKEFDEGTVILADRQTAGRGRLGREWKSEAGKNLTFSVLLKPRISRQQIGILSLYASIAVVDALRQIAGLAAECKWPNDVLIKGKKICGALSEAVFMQDELRSVVVGIGINVNQIEFPSELCNAATSIHIETGSVIDRSMVLARVLEYMESFYTILRNDGPQAVLRHWEKRTTIIGKQISVLDRGTIITGTAKTIASDGGLILEIQGREKKILSGDVSLVQ